MSASVHVIVCERVSVCVSERLRGCVSERERANACVCACVCVHARVYVRAHACVCMHIICAYMYIIYLMSLSFLQSYCNIEIIHTTGVKNPSNDPHQESSPHENLDPPPRCHQRTSHLNPPLFYRGKSGAFFLKNSDNPLLPLTPPHTCIHGQTLSCTTIITRVYTHKRTLPLSHTYL